jgi:hypothetical protein
MTRTVSVTIQIDAPPAAVRAALACLALSEGSTPSLSPPPAAAPASSRPGPSAASSFRSGKTIAAAETSYQALNEALKKHVETR